MTYVGYMIHMMMGGMCMPSCFACQKSALTDS